MGTDIDGWVEIKGPRGWVGVIRVGDIAGRNYDMFGCLFGIANYAHFRSLAHDRGLPADASNRVLFALEQLADGRGITPRHLDILARDRHARLGRGGRVSRQPCASLSTRRAQAMGICG